jgi:cytochrome c1
MARSTKLMLGAALLAAALAGSTVAEAQEGHETPVPARQSWSFAGPFGTFDKGQLQRGFKVYREVCQNCHGLTKVAFRTLAEDGGPDFSEAQVKALAAEYQVNDGPNDQGEMFQRPGRPSDYFPPNYANPQAAKAALGAAPPDMSVLAKARTVERGFPWFILDAFTQYQEQGPDYIYAILNGYTHPDDANYNEYFPGHHIGMPKPLTDGQVDYPDGAPATVQQYAHDVAAFLMWAAEPSLVERKKTGLRVMVFLNIFAGLIQATKRRVWAKVPH